MVTSKKSLAKKTAQKASPAKSAGVAKPLKRTATRKLQATEIYIPLSKIRFDNDQPRTDYKSLDGRMPKEGEAHIIELAKSIKAQSLIEAITVRPDPKNKGGYIVVVGESRTRAHLHLGLKEIRAVVREGLDNPIQRLLFQLAENINRKTLSDDDMARAVVKLRLGDKENGIPGITQGEIADQLGKSEGWVTRYLRYADEEHYRIWVKSGIADSVENLYRITLLPKQTQLDILRRVELPENHPEYLSKPLSRSLIDEFSYKHKQQKKAGGLPFNPSQQPAAAGLSGAETAHSGHPASLETPSSYSLSDEDRNKLLSSNFSGKYQSTEPRDKRIPAIHCRGTLQNTMSLFEFLAENETLQSAMLAVVVDLIIPGELAKDLAAKLSGTVVEDSDVPMSLQNSLSAFNKS